MAIRTHLAATTASALLLAAGLSTGAGCVEAGDVGGAGGAHGGHGGEGGSNGVLVGECEAVCIDSDECIAMMPTHCAASCSSTVSLVEKMGCLVPYRTFLSCAMKKPYVCNGPNPCEEQLTAVNACLDRVGGGGGGAAGARDR